MPPRAVDRFCHRNSHSEVRAPERQGRRWWQHPPPALVMNIPACARVVKGWTLPIRAGHLCPGRRPTCDVRPVGAHPRCASWDMAFPPAPERLIRLFPGRQPWPRQVFASSLAVHMLGFALVGWATRGQVGTAISTPPQQVSRAYALRFFVLNRPPRGFSGPLTRPGPRPERRPPRPTAPVAPVTPSPPLPSAANVVESASQSTAQNTPRIAPQRAQPRASRPPTLETEALAPGVTVGIGQIVPTSHSTAGRGLAGMLGFRGPTTTVQPGRHGLDRLPELVGGAGSACPELGPPARTEPQSAVAVAFVVDTNGRVDRATLHVIESPGRHRTDHQFHARVYVVGPSPRVEPGRTPLAANDSVLTEEVASHVAGLVFRPALRADHVIRSTVLVSCQTF
jgi:hypothetical protein